jgi:hypothetical protein
MKKTLILSGMMLSLLSCSQEFDINSEDVPQAVLTAFQQKYPSVTGTEWEVEKHDGRLVFEAEFKADGKRIEAVFKPDGIFIEEE